MTDEMACGYVWNATNHCCENTAPSLRSHRDLHRDLCRFAGHKSEYPISQIS